MRMKATQDGADAIFLFIAELNGFKTGTVQQKLEFGHKCWLETTLHELHCEVNEEFIKAVQLSDFSAKKKAKFIKKEHLRAENDRKDVHENIWLQRLYDELDGFYQLTPLTGAIYKKRALTTKGGFKQILDNTSDMHRWSTPIELDASASMLQYIGILLNDKRLCEMTNVIGDTLSDPWNFEGIPRTMFKWAATPRLYGSSQACHELWKTKKCSYTLEQVQLFNQELATGALGLADQLKEFIINNCKPEEFMNVQIFDEFLDIECNRYRQVGEKTSSYDIFDTDNATIRRIHHTTTRSVADLDQFRRYFVTLLVHNLDSQVADIVIGKCIDKYGWGMDLHDAFIASPEAAADIRTWYAEAMDHVHANRKTILSNFFKSIGIGSAAQKQWTQLQAMVVPITAPFKCQKMALK